MVQGCSNVEEYVQVPEIVLKGIVHDLNNSLCVIRESVSFIRESLSGDNNNCVFQILDDLEAASCHSVEITRQLHDLIVKRQSENKIADIAELVHRAGKLGLIGSHFACEIHAGHGDWKIECDETSVYRVLVNIIVNARQAMNGNGGSIRINLENLNVSHGNGLPIKPGNYVKLSISDSGKGISPENLKYIFKPGFTTKANGSGIGLVASEHIVKEHGGCIEVNSEVGVGTTFEVYLPQMEEIATKRNREEFVIADYADERR